MGKKWKNFIRLKLILPRTHYNLSYKIVVSLINMNKIQFNKYKLGLHSFTKPINLYQKKIQKNKKEISNQ